MESYLDYFIYVIYYEDMKEVILFIYENIYLILENEFMLWLSICFKYNLNYFFNIWRVLY